MTLPRTKDDREFQKFEDGSDGKVVVRVNIKNPEDLSLSVQEGATASAGETVSAIKAIYSNGTSVFLGDANSTFQEASIIGITVTAANSGSELRYLLNGNMYDSSFAFTDGEPVFLAEDGNLTQTDPQTLGFNYRVLLGYAIGTNGLNINLQEPIQIN